MSKAKERIFRICNIVLYVFLGLGGGGIIFVVINTLSDIEYGPNWLLSIVLSMLFAGSLVVLCAINLIVRLALTTEDGQDNIAPEALTPAGTDKQVNGKINEKVVSGIADNETKQPAGFINYLAADEKPALERSGRMSAEIKYEIINISKMTMAIVIVLAVLAIGIVFYFPHQNLSGTTSFVYMAVCVPVALIAIIAFFAVRYEILKTIPSGNRIKKEIPLGDRVVSYIGIGILCLALVLFCTYTSQNTLLFYPNSLASAEQALELDSDYQRVTVAGKNAEYSGWMYAPHGDQAPTLLIFYGNYQNAARVMADSDITKYAQYNTICIDYPGYGRNDGTPNEQSIFRMALDTYDYIADIPQLNSEKIIVLGHSIGTGIAGYVAANRDVSGLVLLSPYSSGTDLCNSYLNIFHGPLSLLVANRLPSNEYAAKVQVDPLIIASKSDKTVKFGLSEKLYRESYGGRGEFVAIEEEENISHEQLFLSETVAENIVKYFEKMA